MTEHKDQHQQVPSGPNPTPCCGSESHAEFRPFPDLTIGWWVVAFKNLMHPLAVVVGMVCLLIGARLWQSSPGKGAALLSIGALFLLIQILTRNTHIQEGRRLRLRRGTPQLLDPQTGGWKALDELESSIVSITKDYYPFADPWRPFTLGYFGIAITLRDREQPVLHLLPWGLESLRDDQFKWLEERFPNLLSSFGKT